MIQHFSGEELFWLRVEMGCEWLRANYPPEYYEAFRGSYEFWVWWGQVWEQKDKTLRGWNISRDAYVRLHGPTCMRHYPNMMVTKAMYGRLPSAPIPAILPTHRNMGREEGSLRPQRRSRMDDLGEDMWGSFSDVEE